MQLCENCRAPLDGLCRCDDCRLQSTSPYCHVCKEMYRAVVTNESLANESRKWKIEQSERRKRMGTDFS